MPCLPRTCAAEILCLLGCFSHRCRPCNCSCVVEDRSAAHQRLARYNGRTVAGHKSSLALYIVETAGMIDRKNYFYSMRKFPQLRVVTGMRRQMRPRFGLLTYRHRDVHGSGDPCLSPPPRCCCQGGFINLVRRPNSLIRPSTMCRNVIHTDV